MPQHDFVIDNGPGGAVRTDLIAALQALVSMNSGPIEPVTMYAGMLWFDTSVVPNGTLRQRNQSNTAWMAPPIFGSDRVAEIGYFARSTPPTGWLKANGAAVNRTTYALLFTAIGTQFGIGDGSTTFNLPDLRGRFVRVWDDSAGVDPGRAFGSVQADAIDTHVHTATTTVNAGGSHAHSGTISGSAAAGGVHTHSGVTDTEAAHSHYTTAYYSPDTQGDLDSGARIFGSSDGSIAWNVTSSAGGSHAHALSINNSASHTHTVSGSMTSDTEPAHAHTASTSVAANTGAGTETRPVNIALLGCIRYN